MGKTVFLLLAIMGCSTFRGSDGGMKKIALSLSTGNILYDSVGKAFSCYDEKTKTLWFGIVDTGNYQKGGDTIQLLYNYGKFSSIPGLEDSLSISFLNNKEDYLWIVGRDSIGTHEVAYQSNLLDSTTTKFTILSEDTGSFSLVISTQLQMFKVPLCAGWASGKRLTVNINDLSNYSVFYVGRKEFEELVTNCNNLR